MAMRRADAVALPGGTGDHLMADQASLRKLGPPVRVPELLATRLAGEHNPDCSLRYSSLIVYPMSSREVSPLANFQRSLLVQSEVEELQSRIGQWGHSGFVQIKSV